MRVGKTTSGNIIYYKSGNIQGEQLVVIRFTHTHSDSDSNLAHTDCNSLFRLNHLAMFVVAQHTHTHHTHIYKYGEEN